MTKRELIDWLESQGIPDDMEITIAAGSYGGETPARPIEPCRAILYSNKRSSNQSFRTSAPSGELSAKDVIRL